MMVAAVLMVAFQEQAKVPAPTVDEIREAVQVYLAYGLPVPPRGAEIVGIDDSERHTDNALRYELGFRFNDPRTGETVGIVGEPSFGVVTLFAKEIEIIDERPEPTDA